MAFIATALNAQNPLIMSQFTADPTARVFDGKIYLYPSHDIHPSSNPNPSQPDWFCMADYHVFSSDNLTDWTDHGVILDQKDVPWGDPAGFSMWAPDCVKGKDGRYYFYFPDKPKEGRGFGVGVAISDTPYGPFKPEEKNIQGLSGIDPCVLQASNGKNYIFWGGGGLRGAELKDNMLELADDTPSETIKRGNFEMKITGVDVAKPLPEGFKEGPFAFERQGKFYLTFPWVRYKKGDKDKNGNVIDNATETLAYAMSDKPLGPYEFKGIIMEEWENHCWTNHHSIVEWKGQWYIFYHHNDLSPRFDKNRSACCDSLQFNADGTIQQVIPTRRGVGITDGRGHVEMDRANVLGGGATIAYNDTTNCALGWRLALPAGGYAEYGNVRIENPENYTVWVNQPGWFGRMSLKKIEEVAGLALEMKKLDNGLYQLRLENKGERALEVDWISVQPGSSKPLAPLSRGGLETGVYRNLFVEVGHTEAEVEAKLQQVWYDVFEGPNKVYFEVGDTMGYVSDVKNNDVRTEGQSYGLMASVQMGKKDVFDRIWRWSKKYMQNQDGPMKGYFRWSCKTDGTPNAMGPASDGELYYITALIFASNRWGNDTGINYLKEAQYLLDIIQPKTTVFEQTFDWKTKKKLKKPIRMERQISLIDPETQLITFVPGAKYTDPSYHLPAFYEVWARYAQDGRASYWRECARKSREYLHRSIHPMTGLNPDYNNYDGSLLNNGHLLGDCFRYDSWRVPMNIALDYSWSCADREWQHNYGHTIQNFLYNEGIDKFVDQYNVDGTRPEKILRAGNYPEALRHSIGFVATSAAVSLVCTHPKSYEFIEALWNAKHEPDQAGYFDGYYDGLLRLFAFMHLSGRYRVIEREMQFSSYFQEAGAQAAQPDDMGFLLRWKLAEPIAKPNASNTMFVDSYLRENLNWSDDTSIQWKKVDSKRTNVKLFRFASCQNLRYYGVIFQAETVIVCDEEIRDVRLSVGSNSASRWWLDGQEILLMSGDRRMVQDDAMSRRITLHKGRNVLRGAVINGPGMSDFCVRLLDANGQPVKNYTIE